MYILYTVNDGAGVLLGKLAIVNSKPLWCKAINFKATQKRCLSKNPFP